MFSESNTVEQMILDATAKLGDMPASMVCEYTPPTKASRSAMHCTRRTGQSGQRLRV
jgi:hypothetical protein